MVMTQPRGLRRRGRLPKPRQMRTAVAWKAASASWRLAPDRRGIAWGRGAGVVAVEDLELGEHLVRQRGADAGVGVEVVVVDAVQAGEVFEIVEEGHPVVELLIDVVCEAGGDGVVGAVVAVAAVQPAQAA